MNQPGSDREHARFFAAAKGGYPIALSVPTPPPPDWLVRLTRALDSGDPAQRVAAARALLPEIRQEEARVRERVALLSSASFEGIMVQVDGAIIDANQSL